MKQESVFLKGFFPKMDEIPPDILIDTPTYQKNILVGGELLAWDGPFHEVKSPLKVINNTTGNPEDIIIGSYPIATHTQAQSALDAAIAAFGDGRGAWPLMSLEERIDCLESFTAIMKSRRDEIVKLLVWEIGKTITDARKEFDRTVDYINETIKSVKLLNNTSGQFVTQQGFIAQTKRIPHGVVLCMGPFNYPLNETFTTLIPALIMGNTILFKPPKYGTLLFAPLLEAFKDSFPKGVVNTVYGRDIVPLLMQSGKVDVLALIGSSRVADSLKKMHPKSNRLKSILGLDAKNAAIVLDDANLESAVKEVVAGALSFNGQRCTALKMIFVHSAIVDKFNNLLIEEVDKLQIGMPWVPNVSITPLAEPDKPKYLQECIDQAIFEGARIINEDNGGGSMYESLVKPAILFPVNSRMRIYHEEQFGPVIPVMSFESLHTPIKFVTESPYGQQVSIFGNDSNTISYLIDSLAGQVGRININAQCQRSPDTLPFNGRKDSAEGTLSVDEALNAFSVDSVVVTKQTQENEKILKDIIIKNSSKRLSNQIVF